MGGFQGEAKVKVASMNVTALKAHRLEAILQREELQDAEVLLLQETRLHSAKPSWVKVIAEKFGWRVACSEPPDRSSNGAVQQSGTAILWKPCLGKVAIERSKSHRYVGIRTSKRVFVSAYGPAKCPAPWWMDEVVDWTVEAARDSAEGWCLGGDLNWRKCYEANLRGSHGACEMSMPTTINDSYPTRAVSKGITVKQSDAVAIPGIPYHKLVVLDTSIKSEHVRTTRLRRTAVYAAQPEALFLKSDVEELLRVVNEIHPKLEETRGLPERWQRWHARAEQFCEYAAQGNWLLKTSTAERCKGSLPSSRPVASKPSRRSEEPVMLARLKKLGFKLAHRLRSEAPGSQLKDKMMNQYVGICMSGGLTHDCKGMPTLDRAMEVVNRGITDIETRQAKNRSKQWKKHFMEFSNQTWSAAGAIVHEGAEAPPFTAESMSEDWEQIWVPQDPGYDEHEMAKKWRSYTAKVAETLPKSEFPKDWVPEFEDFLKLAEKAKGGAGYDGWQSGEIRLLAKHCPALVREIFELWVDTARHLMVAAQDKELQLLVMQWRVVGIPKKNGDSRPISVASCWFRLWLAALEPSLPNPSGAQRA